MPAAMAVGKILIGIACCIASLYGVGKCKITRTRFLSFFGQGSDSEIYEPAKCHACLAAGKDFCISGNNCIPRATFQCKGPTDHITGDKEFALHGNPRAQHSMVCPKSSPEKGVDTKDCYFDKDCHGKVDWKKIGKIKEGFFARLKLMKEKEDASGVMEMVGKVHTMFQEAGMPDDRIDYILIKWVKFLYPEALVDTKDCYFDKECHQKVDWEKIGKIKEGFFARLKLMKEKRDASGVKEMMAKVHTIFQEAGMPDDRIDYILIKWVKFVYPEALDGKGACSKYASWGEVALEGCQKCEKWYPGKADQCMECGEQCAKYCPKGSDMKCYQGGEFAQCHKKCMTSVKGQSVGMVTV